MLIYTSEKVLPYVYICTHKITGEFYIGSRTAIRTRILPSHLDLPKYKTSSKQVKPRFDEFNWYIIAEFFDHHDAYEFEQKSIYENWNDSLLLNKSCQYGKACWNTSGKTYIRSIETTIKILKTKNQRGITNGKLGTKQSQETINKRINTQKSNGKISPLKGTTRTEETKKKISSSNIGKKRVLIECPVCGKLGGKGVMSRWHFKNCQHLLH